jgi:hypothetical protein
LSAVFRGVPAEFCPLSPIFITVLIGLNHSEEAYQSYSERGEADGRHEDGGLCQAEIR